MIRGTAELSPATMERGAVFCNITVDSFTALTARDTCEGRRRNYSALYTINGSVTGTVEFQFGMDWGCGGFMFLEDDPNPRLQYANTDIWWRRRCNNRDVLTYRISDTANFSSTLLGFEGSCDGFNSARNRSWEYPRVGAATLAQQAPALA